MASATIHKLRCLVLCCCLVFVAASCSADDEGQPASTASATSNGVEGSDEAGGASGQIDAADSGQNASEPSGDETAGGGDGSVRTLESQRHASVTELAVGEMVEDSQGNLIAIYGFSGWSDSFGSLPDASRAQFPFFGDVAAASDPRSSLLVLDIGMCSAGIDADGFGTAEFFLHATADEILSTDQVLDRGVLARHPVVQPGFRFPAAAECTRGFLPVLWSGEGEPGVARYVLASRASADSEVDRHIYQWVITGASIDVADAEPDAASLFAVGQTVTFNDGRLADTTIAIDGWAERVGAASEIEGTRVVAVSLTLCQASPVLPDFGLAVDGWNIVAPLPGGLLDAASATDGSGDCVDGWLDFAVPFGGVPTGFFASDGANSVLGYTEWSLLDAALPVPQ